MSRCNTEIGIDIGMSKKTTFNIGIQHTAEVRKSTKGPEYAYCKVCDSHLKAGCKYDMVRHATMPKHVDKCKAIFKNANVTTFIPDIKHSDKHKSELRIAAFIAEHNLPIAIADHLTELIKTYMFTW